MQYKTRSNSSPQGKPRVYFSCHPNDFDRCFPTLLDEILVKVDCSIWYLPNPQAPRDDDFFNDLSLMQLMVMPVSTDLLETENDTLLRDFAFAAANGIPVLPIMLEGGLDEQFNQACGDIHYLTWHHNDLTAISYDKKLEQFLFSVLIKDELAEKIRAAFDAYVFLSYRKKDRQYARQLMRLIHENDFCRDIAIWYDEFLTPGENFNDMIRLALEKSDLFVLTVTPNVVNEINYIMTTEYPLAQSNRKPILPVEMLPTDQQKLLECYHDIPPCTGSQASSDLYTSLQNALHHLSLGKRDSDAQHTFFIGLAYLSGIDVEVDHGLAVSLITKAAEQNLPEAMEKLVSLYTNGIGVQRNKDEALYWSKRIAAFYYEKAFDEGGDLCNTEAAKELFLHCGDKLWADAIVFFLLMADDNMTLQQIRAVTLLAVSECGDNYSPLFDACLQMHNHQDALQQLLLADILHKTVDGIYKPYGHLFCWPMIHSLFEETLLAAEQFLKTAQLLPSKKKTLVTLLRDLCVIAGYDAVCDVLSEDKIPLLMQVAAEENVTTHRSRLNTLFYAPEKADWLRQNTEPDHIYPQIFSLSYLLGMETELCRNVLFYDDYGLWDQISCEDSIGMTAINYDTLTPRTPSCCATPELVTGAVCWSREPTSRLFFGLPSLFPNLFLLILPNATRLEKHCFCHLNTKVPHLALCLPSGIKQLASVDPTQSTDLKELRVQSLYLYANNLQRIPMCAFENMNLRRIRLPQCLKKLGAYAFSNTDLAQISIPDSVEEIEEGAFFLCRHLKEVHLPQNLKILGHAENRISSEKGVFQACVGLTQLELPEGTEHIGYSTFAGCSNLKTVYIPETVSDIHASSFRNCSALEEIKLPSQLCKLSAMIFMDCTSLRSVTIPPKVTTIGVNAFDGCIHLESIDLPERLEMIGQAAFSKCSALKKIHLPQSVSKIDNCAFEYCTALEQIDPLPNLSSIAPATFRACASLKYVTIPATVTCIRRFAFADCTGLKEMVVPCSVERVEQQAFQRCTALTAVTVEGSNTVLEEDAFSECTCTIIGGLKREKDILIENVSAVSERLCYRYDWLETVTMGDSVLTVGKQAFYECSLLQSVVLGAKTQRIEESAFNGCTALSSVHFPETLTHIGAQAFEGCVSLTQLELPPALTTLQLGAFRQCTGLTSVCIPRSLTVLGHTDPRYIFITGVFQGCSNLKNVSLHDNITDLGPGTFYGTAIETIQIPPKVEILKNFLFYECRQLTNVILPNGLKQITARVFDGCTALKNVQLPSTLQSLGSCAFRQCISLHQIVIPDSVAIVENLAFDGCVSLEKVVLPKYLAELAERIFSGCTNLKSITLPEKLVSIGSGAFSGCSNLREINLPVTVRNISAGAFESCSALHSVVIPEGVTVLNPMTFCYCKSLQYVSLPNTLKSIERRAFGECSELRDLYIPDSVEHIDIYAFNHEFIRKISVPSHLVNTIKLALGEPNDIEENTSRTTLFY